MALTEVVRAADLLARGWAGSWPAELDTAERCRQLVSLLRQHDPALVAEAEGTRTVPDAARLQRALMDAARQSPGMRSLLGQLAPPGPVRAPRAGQRVWIEGSHNQVAVGEVVHMNLARGPDVPPPVKPRILLLAANPRDTGQLRWGQEQRDIREALLLSGDRYGLETRPAVRPRDLTLALVEIRPRILHFSGHGNADGGLCLEGEGGYSHPVPPQTLADVFSVLKGQIECVVLNACFASIQAQEISRHVRYVVGMVGQVGDAGALAFATGFYQAVGAGASIPEAVGMGRALFNLLRLPDPLAPVLMQDGLVVA